MQVFEIGAIAVVVDVDPQALQALQAVLGQGQRAGDTPGAVLQVVTEGTYHRPLAERTAQVLIDENAGADIRGGIDHRLQAIVGGDIAGKVVVAVEYLGARCQRPLQASAVLVQGHVQHGHPGTGSRFHPLQQVDIALNAGYQLRLQWLGIAQLGQRTQAVGITVENVKMSHGEILVEYGLSGGKRRVNGTQGLSGNSSLTLLPAAGSLSAARCSPPCFFHIWSWRTS